MLIGYAFLGLLLVASLPVWRIGPLEGKSLWELANRLWGLDADGRPPTVLGHVTTEEAVAGYRAYLSKQQRTAGGEQG